VLALSITKVAPRVAPGSPDDESAAHGQEPAAEAGAPTAAPSSSLQPAGSPSPAGKAAGR
jgi:hypothetical protein